MAIQLTWADITATVAEFHGKEGAKPNRSLYLSLGNEFLAIVAEQTECYHKTWTNAAGGDLTISTATVTLPIDVIRVTRVEWDSSDEPLEFREAGWLDENLPGWREDTGDPEFYTIEGNALVLSSAPSGTVTGKLTVRGVAYLPNLSDDTSASNPLVCLPVGLQRSVADYILASLPFDPQVPVENVRFQRFNAKMQPVLDRLYSQANARAMERFGY